LNDPTIKLSGTCQGMYHEKTRKQKSKVQVAKMQIEAKKTKAAPKKKKASPKQSKRMLVVSDEDSDDFELEDEEDVTKVAPLV
jgi:hypothetical protein